MKRKLDWLLKSRDVSIVFEDNAIRTGLHSSRLGFVHPAKGEKVMFESDLPKDMRSVIRMLAKYRPHGKRTLMTQKRT